jgi:hypothetical protein
MEVLWPLANHIMPIVGLWLKRSMSHSVTRSVYTATAQPQHSGVLPIDIAGIVDMVGSAICR